MPNARVLVVDDEPLVADTLGLIFRRRGFECRVAYSGAEALAQVQTFAPSLLLLDIDMPGINGLDVARSLDVSHPECRVLMLTGNYGSLREAHEVSRVLRRPLEFVIKPIMPDLLLAKATSLLATT